MGLTSSTSSGAANYIDRILKGEKRQATPSAGTDEVNRLDTIRRLSTVEFRVRRVTLLLPTGQKKRGLKAVLKIEPAKK